jgi:nucleoside-diphosphate-sugar epimerase
MLKLAVVGANGQVGAELCLLLAAHKDIQLIPICRNQSGSAFLRWHGIACRHGRITDPADAARLIGDCDVIVNSALATGTPAQIRRIEDQIIQRIFRHSKDSATIIHFSTQSVYGDPGTSRWVRWRNPYGRAKLATERQIRLQSRSTKRLAFILRLGHVCGAMQEISNTIRAGIHAQSVCLPAENRSSNTVYTAAIIGAIDQILAGRAQPNTYDLMNTPRWTWREVYEYEAAVCQLPLALQIIGSHPGSPKSGILRSAVRFVGSLAAAGPIRDLVAKLFAYIPDSMNARGMAWWYAKRARTEIAKLGRSRELPEHLYWVENGVNFFPAETATIDLLRSLPALQETAGGAAESWPADLPDARRPVSAQLATTTASG